MRVALVAVVASLAAVVPATAARATVACPTGVTGTNPSYADTAALLASAAAAHDVPPVVLAAIAYREGYSDVARRWSQYNSDGTVVVSDPAGVCGIGIMQVSKDAGYDVPRLASDVAYDIDVGATILAAKFDANQAGNPPAIGPDDRYLVENWYYAVQAYNGVSGATTTYTDAIARIVADPFRYAPETHASMTPLGDTTPKDAKPSYAFPAGFQARRSPASFYFYDGTTVAAPVHDWRTPPAVVYPAGTYGPDGPYVGCAPLVECQYWRLAAGSGLAGRAHWTKSNGATQAATVVWSPPLAARTYCVAAYVPAVAADPPTGTATYTVAGSPVTVDQAALPGAWAPLGLVPLAPGDTVVLGDKGDPAGTAKVVADGIRFATVAAPSLAGTPSTVPRGGSVTLSGRVVCDGTTVGLAGATVRLIGQRPGSLAVRWRGAATTSAAGYFSVTVPVRESLAFTARATRAGLDAGIARTTVTVGS